MRGAVKKIKKTRSDIWWRVKAIGIAIGAWIMVPGVALANNDLLSAAFGGAAPAGIEEVSDEELDTLRGGDFTSIAFGLFLYVDINNFADPIDPTAPDGVDITTTPSGEVQVIMGLGEIGGANGVIQFTNINGSGNVVNNNLIMNVIVAQSGADVPDLLSSAFPFGN